jgi:flagellar biosynthetic protein FlhB
VAEEVDRESKTEEPTPRRREEARRKGQFPFSSELVGSVVLFGGVISLIYLGPLIWTGMLELVRHDLRLIFHSDFDPEEARVLMQRAFLRMLTVLIPFLGLLLVIGVGSCIVQVGFQFNTEKITPDFDKLNIALGLQRLFSMAALIRGLLTILKVIALGIVAYVVVEGRGGIITTLSRYHLSAATAVAWAVVVRLGQFLAGAILLVAVVDYLYQRRRFEQSLRMTREEIKRELKEDEGDPQIKARIRQLQRERSRRKMLAEVPKATVVITNPLHYAVALRYDPSRDPAPVVVAKGSGVFARRIAELARSHAVPVLERPPLAKALHALREGQPIPGPLFRAVAEVIAFVYRLRGMGGQGSLGKDTK